ncbi:MAG: signal recognition particle-docking protein FtsY [Alphaproteobacteria bacterium]|nr:signal recognition particle-docking protein FtsY [Alphaproteobacteria bacterium]
MPHGKADESHAHEPPASPENTTKSVEPITFDAPTAKRSWFAKLTNGLTKTSSRLSQGITGIFTQAKLDADTLDDFEDILIQSDLGVETATRIRDELSTGRFDKEVTADDVKSVLAREVERVLEPTAKPLEINASHAPHVILVVGVNGSGKTTTIGKLAAQYRADGHTVMIAAGDTFRAAAIDQLKVWGQRANVTVVSRDVGSDASALAFDAMAQAKCEGVDVLLIDTAGRLQNKQALMEELEKVIRVIRKQAPDAPHDTLLVLDATTGQNALTQVDAFQNTAGVTGLIMTKLDGTARGGILVSIAAKYGLPVHAIGVGEGIDDLQPFDAAEFADAIAGR